MDVKKLAYLLLLCTLGACKREEPTVWAPHIKSPIAYGSIGLGQWLDSDFLMADENQLWHLKIERNLTNFNIDSLVEIPDTTIRKSLVLPFVGGPISLPAGTQLYNESVNNTIQTQGAQLKEVILRSGYLHYDFTSYVNGALTCTCALPGASLNGLPLILEANTDPSANDLSPSQVSGTIDLSNYHIDFSGNSGNGFNLLESIIQVQVSNNSTSPAQVYGNDSVTVDLRFEDAVVAYGRGYFGQHTFNINETINFGSDFALPSGQILFDHAQLNLEFKNFVGVDLQLQLQSLTGLQNNTQVELQSNNLFDWYNFTRATDLNGNVVPSSFDLQLDQSNSNITDFIGNLPHTLQLNGVAQINPLGNISLNNDFIYTQQTIETKATLDIPLNFASNGITLSDTLSLTNQELDLTAEGELLVVMDNYFPCNVIADARLKHNDESFVLLNQAQLLAAQGQPERSIFSIPINEDIIHHFKAGAFIILQITLSTADYPQLQPLYQSQRIDYQFIANGSIQLEYE